MSSASALRTILGKPFMPPVFFFSGVTYDTLTLTRIDRLQDNLLLLIYLLLLGVLIVLTGRLGIEPAPEREQLAAFSPFVRWVLRVRPFYPMAVRRDRLSSVRLLVSLYALVCFALFTVFLPVMTGYMNAAVFLVGAVLSAVVTFRVVQLVYRNNPDRSKREAIGAITIPARTGFSRMYFATAKVSSFQLGRG